MQASLLLSNLIPFCFMDSQQLQTALSSSSSTPCFLFMMLPDTNFVTFSFQAVEEEDKMTPEQLAIKNVGKQVHQVLVIL